MQRRRFLGAMSMAGIAAAVGEAQDRAAKPVVEFYELRRYHLRSGTQSTLTANYLKGALVPALNRAGITPVGVFNVTFGEGPTAHVLIPHKTLDSAVMSKARLMEDSEYMKAAAPFLDAAPLSPAFDRLEVSLLVAFEGYPRLQAPGTDKPRVFELRRYESPTIIAGKKKVQMFNNGEIGIFKRLGFRPVFFAEAIVGSHLPCLEYMTTFESLADRETKWKSFSGDEEWKKLSGMAEYKDIVSNQMMHLVSPTPFSQI